MSREEMSTVGELLDYLAGQPRERKIVLQKDAEGNGYSPLAIADEWMYEATSTWSGEVSATPERQAAEPGEWSDASPSAERVVVLEPVN